MSDGPYDYAWERWDAQRVARPDPRDDLPDPADYMDLEE